MDKPTANSAFLKGLRYMFILWLTLLSFLFLLSVGLRVKGDILFSNLLLGYIGIIITAYVLSFITAYFAVKKGVEAGESSDDNILTKNGRLNLNFFKKNKVKV